MEISPAPSYSTNGSDTYDSNRTYDSNSNYSISIPTNWTRNLTEFRVRKEMPVNVDLGGPWNIRWALILGLLLQAFLIIYAPYRKRKSSKKLIRLIWLAYFLADWTANFALGLISTTQGNYAYITYAYDQNEGTYVQKDEETQGDGSIHGKLLSFWLPFLLIQLGGADTLVLSDIQIKSLFSRGVLVMYFHVGVTCFVFLKYWYFQKVPSLMPVLLLLVVGITKYLAGGYAVHLASLNNVKKFILKQVVPAGPSSSKLEEYRYHSNREAKIPVQTDVVKQGELENDIAVVQRAYHFFKRSRGLLIGLLYSFEERRQSRMFFQQRTPEEAYKLIAVELNFMYDSLFTKALLFHSKMGYLIRTISFSSLVFALISFNKQLKQKKHAHGHGFPTVDTGITYMLLYGAIALDTVSFLQHIFSDWTVVAFGGYMQYSCVAFVFGKYLTLKRSTLTSSRRTINAFQRWSKSVTTFSFLAYSIKKRSKTCLPCSTLCKRIQNMFLLKGTAIPDAMKFGSIHPFTGELWDFIYMELKRKSALSDTQIGTEIYPARGDWILQDSKWKDDCSHLLSFVNDYDYDQSILLWHIATEILYNTDKSNVDGDANRREHCKTMSGYMLYLLILQPMAMSAVTGIFGEVGFRDTSAEAKLILMKKDKLALEDEDAKRILMKKDLPALEDEDACKLILKELGEEVKLVDVERMNSKSVLSDACALTEELKKMGEKKWELLSEMWVEMLSYAASHCEVKSHVDFLARGGELVTFVWLLMAHLGIMETLVQTKEVNRSSVKQVNEC